MSRPVTYNGKKLHTAELFAQYLKSDLRVESTFNAGIAPASGKPWPTTLLILRNNVAYPLIQGFLWALAKDWLHLASAAMQLHGSILGAKLHSIFHSWLSKWMHYGMIALSFNQSSQ